MPEDLGVRAVGDSYTIDGAEGYIGISWHHKERSWHIGTPYDAMSIPLIVAMKEITKTKIIPLEIQRYEGDHRVKNNVPEHKHDDYPFWHPVERVHKKQN